MMIYYVIATGNPKGSPEFWTGKGWTDILAFAKRYKSRKMAENAMRRTTTNFNFGIHKRKEVIEIVSSSSNE